jgi:hypothetical protein
MKRGAEIAKEFEFSVCPALLDRDYQFYLSVYSIYSPFFKPPMTVTAHTWHHHFITLQNRHCGFTGSYEYHWELSLSGPVFPN